MQIHLRRFVEHLEIDRVTFPYWTYPMGEDHVNLESQISVDTWNHQGYL